VYPWYGSSTINSFNAVLGQTLNNYLTANGYTLNDCLLNTLTTNWFVEIKINDSTVIQYPFFDGIGYTNISLSSPQPNDWDSALLIALNDLTIYGYDYYLTTTDTVVIYNSICSTSAFGDNFKLNVGINFNILCN